MSDVKDYNTGSVNPHNLYDTLEYKLLFARDNPDFSILVGFGCIVVLKVTERH